MPAINKRVLIVDDDVNLLDGVIRRLRRKFDVISATSGAHALELLRNTGPPVVIVSDFQMPEMNGVALLW